MIGAGGLCSSPTRIHSNKPEPMNWLPLTFIGAACSLLVAHSAHAQLEVGAASQVTSFALFDGNSLSNKSLEDFEGKVVVMYYLTPW